MGVYDIYEGVQLKVGDVMMQSYRIGDEVEIPDGIYIGYGGAIVIKDRKFVAKFSCVMDKWGDEINCADIINPINPISAIIPKDESKEG